MFREQVTTDIYVGNIVYAIGILCVVLAAAAIFVIDLGLVRRKNALDTVVQKLGAGMAGALGFAPVGYAIWVWQVNTAVGIPNPLGQAIKDWWIGGPALNSLPQNVDPALLPTLDTFQVYYVLFVVFAFFLGVVLHSAGMERLRALPLYALSFAGGAVVLPFAYYLLWGSPSPLTNGLGVHDFVGTLAVYCTIGGMGLVLAWRVGPRIGRFGGGNPADLPGPTNLPLIALGIALVLPALTFFPLVAGYVLPGTGFVGISMTTSGMGLILENLWAAVIGGGIAGLLMSYRTRNPYWLIAGPFVGYVAGGTLFDIARPWYMFFIGMGAPVVTMLTIKLLVKLKIDEDKLVPLILGPAAYGVLVGGFTEWGTPTGGYLGITEGKFAFQNAEITPWGQLVGVLVGVGIGAVVALVVCAVFARIRGGLRVSAAEEAIGLDATYWGPVPDEALVEGEDRLVGSGALP